MKKFLSLFAACAIIMSVWALPASAKVGDVVGEVVYTDISAYINHYPISAYAYDGGMVVVAEDLNNYGFDVTYNDATRSLSIMPNREKQIAGMSPVYKNAHRARQHFANALSSDINVYFNGTWINSCAINGYMMVKLEDLASDYAGTSFTWDNGTRSAKLWIDWSPITAYRALSNDPSYNPNVSVAGRMWIYNGEGRSTYSFDFRSNGSVYRTSYHNTRTGTYSVSGDTITVHITESNNSPINETYVLVYNRSNNTMRCTNDGKILTEY